MTWKDFFLGPKYTFKIWIAYNSICETITATRTSWPLPKKSVLIKRCFSQKQNEWKVPVRAKWADPSESVYLLCRLPNPTRLCPPSHQFPSLLKSRSISISQKPFSGRVVHQEIDIKAARANPPWLNSTSLVSIGGPDGISSVQMNFPHVHFKIYFLFSFDHTGCI